MVAVVCELVLLAPCDAIFLCQIFRRDAHGTVGLGIVLSKPWIEARIESTHGHLGHGFHATRKEYITCSRKNGASRHEHRLLTGSTETIHRGGAGCKGQTRAKGHHARQIHALLAFGHGATHNDILEITPVLQQRLDGLDHQRAHGLWSRGGCAAFDGAANGRALGFNDDGRSHGWLLDAVSLAPRPVRFHRLPRVEQKLFGHKLVPQFRYPHVHASFCPRFSDGTLAG